MNHLDGCFSLKVIRLQKFLVFVHGFFLQQALIDLNKYNLLL